MKSLIRLNRINRLKKLILFRLLILLIYLKKADYDTQIAETEKKIPDHGNMLLLKNLIS